MPALLSRYRLKFLLGTGRITRNLRGTMRRLLFIFLMVIFVLPSLLFAQNRQFQQKQNRQKQNPKISILDETQRKEWQSIRIEFQKQKNVLKAKLQNARLDLWQLMNEKRIPDENDVNKKLDEIAKYTKEHQQLSYEKQIEFRKLISDDQWQQIQELKKKRYAAKRRNQLNQRNLRKRPNRKL